MSTHRWNDIGKILKLAAIYSNHLGKPHTKNKSLPMYLGARYPPGYHYFLITSYQRVIYSIWYWLKNYCQKKQPNPATGRVQLL